MIFGGQGTKQALTFKKHTFLNALKSNARQNPKKHRNQRPVKTKINNNGRPHTRTPVAGTKESVVWQRDAPAERVSLANSRRVCRGGHASGQVRQGFSGAKEIPQNHLPRVGHRVRRIRIHTISNSGFCQIPWPIRWPIFRFPGSPRFPGRRNKWTGT